jgi:hypothetical protein
MAVEQSRPHEDGADPQNEHLPEGGAEPAKEAVESAPATNWWVGNVPEEFLGVPATVTAQEAEQERIQAGKRLSKYIRKLSLDDDDSRKSYDYYSQWPTDRVEELLNSKCSEKVALLELYPELKGASQEVRRGHHKGYELYLLSFDIKVLKKLLRDRRSAERLREERAVHDDSPKDRQPGDMVPKAEDEAPAQLQPATRTTGVSSPDAQPNRAVLPQSQDSAQGQGAHVEGSAVPTQTTKRSPETKAPRQEQIDQLLKSKSWSYDDWVRKASEMAKKTSGWAGKTTVDRSTAFRFRNGQNSKSRVRRLLALPFDMKPENWK